MNYTEWAATVPQEITQDRLWPVEAYRQALFAGERCKELSALLENIPLP